MRPAQKKSVLVTAMLAVLLCSVALVFTRVRSRSRKATGSVSAAHNDELPVVILWAWERPSDLRFIDPRQVGVAFLAQTVLLRGGEVVVRPRLQPLDLPPGTKLVAVTRVESDRKQSPQLSPAQRQSLASSIAEITALPNISAIQIDFDATRSERAFYHDLILEVRERLPQNVSLSITALASWCADDNWLSDLPIDDAVPMLFRMGPDRSQIINRVSAGQQFSSAPCQDSYGISTDEPVPGLSQGKRLYVFNPRAWSEDSVRAILDSTR
jgi:hypothetical protein